MNKHGFTLIEALFAACVLIVLVAIGGTITLSGCQSKVKAEDAARAWAKSMGIVPKGVNCVSKDTDGDGYISCTVSEERKDGTKMHALECASSWSWNSGCRQPKLGAR